MKTKKISLIVLLLTVTLVVGAIYGQQAVPERKLEELNVDARNEPREKNDWLTGEITDNDPMLLEFIRQIQDTVSSKDSSVIKDVYGGRYVNPANNTLFLSVTQLDQETTQSLNIELKIPDTITVIYRKCLYPKVTLDKGYNDIFTIVEPLSDEGVNILGFGVKGKGYIWIELEEVSYYSVSTLLDYLPESVPKDALMIRKGEIAYTASQTSKHRPVFAGIKFQGQKNIILATTGTLGFYGTDGSGNEGLLTCAHLIDTGMFNDAWQPTNWFGNKIGDCIHRGTDTSDSAFIELTPSVSGIYEVYPDTSGYDYVVENQIEYEDMTEGWGVRYCGITSGIVSTTIEDLGAKYHPIYGTLPDQGWLDDPCEDGDSGSPVYLQVYQGSMKYRLTAYGIVWGYSDSYSYFSPIDNMEDDFDTTLDVTE